MLVRRCVRRQLWRRVDYLAAPRQNEKVAARGMVAGLAACDGSWVQFRADAERTGYNPRETALDAGNVSGLQVAWSVPIPEIVRPDGGGNVARYNGDPRQCVNIICRT